MTRRHAPSVATTLLRRNPTLRRYSYPPPTHPCPPPSNSQQRKPTSPSPNKTLTRNLIPFFFFLKHRESKINLTPDCRQKRTHSILALWRQHQKRRERRPFKSLAPTIATHKRPRVVFTNPTFQILKQRTAQSELTLQQKKRTHFSKQKKQTTNNLHVLARRRN